MQQGKHYIVIDWSKDQPKQPMRVFVSQITDTVVKVHITYSDYPTVMSSTWPLELAKTWQWTETKKETI